MSHSKPSFPPGSLGVFDRFPEHGRLITYIVTQWNKAEFLAAEILAQMMHTHAHNIGRMIYALNNSSARLDVIEAGIANLSKNQLLYLQIADALSNARIFLNARNRYAHATYLASPNGKSLHRIDWRKPSKKGTSTVSLKTLEKDVEFAQHNIEALANILGILTKNRPLQGRE